MDAAGRKFLAEALKGIAKGISSGSSETELPTPVQNFVAKLCESGEDLIDDLILTPVMKDKFDKKMMAHGQNINRPELDEVPAEEVAATPEIVPSLTQEENFQW